MPTLQFSTSSAPPSALAESDSCLHFLSLVLLLHLLLLLHLVSSLSLYVIHQISLSLTLSLFLSPFPSSLHHCPFFHLQIWCLVVWWRLWRVSEVVGRGVWPVVLCFVKDIFSAQVVQCILIMKFRKLCVLRYMFYKVTNICFLQVTTMAFFGRIGNLLRQTASRQVSS